MASKQRPNILWYCTDQQRYDTIHALGNQYIRTPHLDQLIEQGLAFTNAYTQSPICTPSRATFLTGRYPASHHVHRNGCENFPDSEILVTGLLAEAGYDCGLRGKIRQRTLGLSVEVEQCQYTSCSFYRKKINTVTALYVGMY